VEIFRRVISNSKQDSITIFLYIQFGKFLAHNIEDKSEARKVFNEATDKYPGSKDLWLAFILFEKQVGGPDMEKHAIMAFEKAIHSEVPYNNNGNENGLSPYFALSQKDRESLLVHFMNFLNDFGADLKRFRELAMEYHLLITLPSKKRERVEGEEYEEEPDPKKAKTDQEYYQNYYYGYNNYPYNYNQWTQ